LRTPDFLPEPYIYYYDGDLMDIVYFLIISKKNRKIIFLTAIIDYW
jgi:hypothetical protein